MQELSELFKLVAEEKRRKKQIEEEEEKSISELINAEESIQNIFSQLAKPKKVKKKKNSIQKQEESIELPVKEKIITEGLLNIPPDEKTPDPLTPLNQNYVTLDDLQNHYKLFLNRIQQQLSTLGGGGETNLAYMDMPLTYVTSSSYTITPQDYYVGVNYAGAVTITLPTPRKNGKVYIVKDELGEASKGTNRYITILPSGSDKIDGRDRAILAYDFGSLTFVYRNGWRVV